MQTTTNDGVTIAYEVAGQDDGDPVVLVEGLGYGRWMWRWQKRALAEDYRVITWDNRGTGDSDVPEGPYSMSDMAGDLAAVLDAAGVETAHVVGASMGGMIAQQYAIEYDGAATLSLFCTSHGGPEEVPMPEETQATIFAVPEGADERETIRHRMAPAVSDGFYDDQPDLVEGIVDWRLEGDATEAGRTAQAGAVQAFDVSDRVGDVDVPALVLHGEADRVVPVENGELLHEKLPDSRLHVREGGPHLFFIESADWVNGHLRSFLEAHPIAEDGG